MDGEARPNIGSDELLAKAARTDPDAIAELYRRYANLIFQYAYRGTGERVAAEDVTSQVFLTMVRQIGRFSGGSFRAWLFTIARHAVIDRHRGAARSASLPENYDAADPAPGPDALLLAREAAYTVNRLLAFLSADQRAVIELHLAGLSGPEIADVLGKRHDSIRALQSRALTKLRAIVSDQPELRSVI